MIKENFVKYFTPIVKLMNIIIFIRIKSFYDNISSKNKNDTNLLSKVSYRILYLKFSWFKFEQPISYRIWT